MAIVRIEEIEKQLGKILDDFNLEVNIANVKAVNKTATETAKYLKEKSPKSKRHAKKNGGRTRAIVHIAPAEKFAKTLYLENLKKGVEKIK